MASTTIELGLDSSPSKLSGLPYLHSKLASPHSTLGPSSLEVSSTKFTNELLMIHLAIFISRPIVSFQSNKNHLPFFCLLEILPHILHYITGTIFLLLPWWPSSLFLCQPLNWKVSIDNFFCHHIINFNGSWTILNTHGFSHQFVLWCRNLYFYFRSLS